MQLRIVQPGGKAHRIALNSGRSLRIGCDPLLEIVLKGPGIAPLHCGVVFQQGHFQLLPSKDVGQIELNGSPVSAAALKVGDRFHVGRFAIQVVADAPAGGAAQRAKPAPADLARLEEPSTEELAPLQPISSDELTPLDEASSGELTPLDDAALDELTPLDEAGLDELAPLEEAGLDELAPLDSASASELTPLEDAPLDELTPLDANVGNAAPAAAAESLFDLDDQSPSQAAADGIPLDDAGKPPGAETAVASAAKAPSRVTVAAEVGVLPGADTPRC